MQKAQRLTSRESEKMPDGTGLSQPTSPTAWGIPDHLMIWLSPGFPTGAFAYSHGLEKLVEDGAVCTRSDLEAWLRDLATIGSLKNDLIFVAETWRAVAREDRERLSEISSLAIALQPAAERRLEAVTQGSAFRLAIAAAWPSPALRLHEEGEIAYPVAVGLAAAAHSLPLSATLRAYAMAFVANLVSAAIRLSVIGQTDGQRTIASLLSTCRIVAASAEPSTLDDLGSATFATDLASLLHETQYTRLFRS